MNIKLAFGSPHSEDLSSWAIWMTKVLGCHTVNTISIQKFKNCARSRSVLVRFVKKLPRIVKKTMRENKPGHCVYNCKMAN